MHVLTAEKTVSLLPTEIGVKRVESTRKHQQVLAAGIAIVIIVIIAVCGVTWSGAQKSKEKNLDNMIATTQGLAADAKKQLSLELVLANKLRHSVTPIDVLHVLSKLFTDRTKVAWKTFEANNLDDFSKTRITFSLQANAHDSIDSMIDEMRNSKIFSDIDASEVTTIGDERRPTFEVKINCKLATEAVQKIAQMRYPKPELKLIEKPVADNNTSPEDQDTDFSNADEKQEMDMQDK